MTIQVDEDPSKQVRARLVAPTGETVSALRYSITRSVGLRPDISSFEVPLEELPGSLRGGVDINRSSTDLEGISEEGSENQFPWTVQIAGPDVMETEEGTLSGDSVTIENMVFGPGGVSGRQSNPDVIDLELADVRARWKSRGSLVGKRNFQVKQDNIGDVGFVRGSEARDIQFLHKSVKTDGDPYTSVDLIDEAAEQLFGLNKFGGEPFGPPGIRSRLRNTRSFPLNVDYGTGTSAVEALEALAGKLGIIFTVDWQSRLRVDFWDTGTDWSQRRSPFREALKDFRNSQSTNVEVRSIPQSFVIRPEKVVRETVFPNWEPVVPVTDGLKSIIGESGFLLSSDEESTLKKKQYLTYQELGKFFGIPPQVSMHLAYSNMLGTDFEVERKNEGGDGMIASIEEIHGISFSEAIKKSGIFRWLNENGNQVFRLDIDEKTKSNLHEKYKEQRKSREDALKGTVGEDLETMTEALLLQVIDGEFSIYKPRESEGFKMQVYANQTLKRLWEYGSEPNSFFQYYNNFDLPNVECGDNKIFTKFLFSELYDFFDRGSRSTLSKYALRKFSAGQNFSSVPIDISEFSFNASSSTTELFEGTEVDNWVNELTVDKDNWVEVLSDKESENSKNIQYRPFGFGALPVLQVNTGNLSAQKIKNFDSSENLIEFNYPMGYPNPSDWANRIMDQARTNQRREIEADYEDSDCADVDDGIQSLIVTFSFQDVVAEYFLEYEKEAQSLRSTIANDSVKHDFPQQKKLAKVLKEAEDRVLWEQVAEPFNSDHGGVSATTPSRSSSRGNLQESSDQLPTNANSMMLRPGRIFVKAWVEYEFDRIGFPVKFRGEGQISERKHITLDTPWIEDKDGNVINEDQIEKEIDEKIKKLQGVPGQEESSSVTLVGIHDVLPSSIAKQVSFEITEGGDRVDTVASGSSTGEGGDPGFVRPEQDSNVDYWQ